MSDRSEADLAAARARMVETQLAPDITDARVLAAMAAVPRHAFVPPELRGQAYDDRPLPIGRGQTISQPFIVAAMTELAGVGPGARVLEIGTGSGYQAAVLCALGAELWSIEIDPVLAERAALALRGLGLGDGDGLRRRQRERRAGPPFDEEPPQKTDHDDGDDFEHGPIVAARPRRCQPPADHPPRSCNTGGR